MGSTDTGTLFCKHLERKEKARDRESEGAMKGWIEHKKEKSRDRDTSDGVSFQISCELDMIRIRKRKGKRVPKPSKLY